MKKPVCIVVAYGRNRVIGVEGDLPWKLHSDLQHFKALTLGCPLIMGRKTFDSIGKPLPGRETIILTRQPDFAPKGAQTAATLEEALALAHEKARQADSPRIIIAGGGEIYRQSLPYVDRVYATAVDAAPEGDTFFPPLPPDEWQETERKDYPAGEHDDHRFSCITYQKV